MEITERRQRYDDKILLAGQRVANIQDWISDITSEMQRLATYKAIEDLIETLSDISAMICRDAKLNTRDDYSNFRKLNEVGIISELDGQRLSEAKGLQNRLTHHYDGIDDGLVISSFRSLFPDLLSILEEFVTWIDQNMH